MLSGIIKTLEEKEISETEFCSRIGIPEYIWYKLKSGKGKLEKLFICASYGFLGLEIPTDLEEKLLNENKKRVHELEFEDNFTEEIRESLLLEEEKKLKALETALLKEQKQNKILNQDEVVRNKIYYENKIQELQKKLKQSETDKQNLQQEVDNLVSGILPNRYLTDTDNMSEEYNVENQEVRYYSQLNKLEKYEIYTKLIQDNYEIKTIIKKYNITFKTLQKIIRTHKIYKGELLELVGNRKNSIILKEILESGRVNVESSKLAEILEVRESYINRYLQRK